MRYIFAAIIVSALGMPTAFAFPQSSPGLASASDHGLLLQTKGAKSGKSDKSASSDKSDKSAKSQSKKTDSGIHPLVGSGDY